MQKSVILLYMYNGFLLSWDMGLRDRGLTPVPTIFNIMEKDNA